VNPYRLPRLLMLIPAVVCPLVALGLLSAERAEIPNIQASDHPWLTAGTALGAVVSIPLYRWLYKKEDRWTLADVPGWEEEVEAEAEVAAASEPIDFWGRFWPAFWALMLPPVGVIVGIRAVRRAPAADRSWAVGSLTLACILTVLPLVAIATT
jgi:hypothetical protein